MNRSTQRQGISSGLWLLVLLVATFAVYFSGLHIWYYGDDFQYLYPDPASRIFYYFFNRNAGHGFYRPVNSSIIALVQMFAGWETWPIHVINIIVHGLLAWLVFLFMRRERFTEPQALIASAFMVISQENAAAVLSNDTFSQISGTFFGCLTLWVLYRGFFRSADTPRAPHEPYPRTHYLLSLPLFVICLLSKETSVSFLPMVGLFFLIKNWRLQGWKNMIVRTAIEVLPFFIATLAYLGARMAIGLSQPSASSGGYGFQFGFNIVKNLGQFLFAAIVPASSASAYVAITEREKMVIGLILLGSLLFLGMVLYGLWKGGRRRSYLALGLFTLAGLFPAMFMNHVGELYLYNSMPFIAVFVGAGIGTLLERTRGALTPRVALMSFIVTLTISHIVAIQMKAAVMRENGARARMLLSKLVPHAAALPTDGHLLLLNPPSSKPEYSIFLINGFGVFRWGEQVIADGAKRSDVRVQVVEPFELADSSKYPGTHVVTLEGDSVVKYQEER